MPRPRVGTLREKPLHAALKRWYAEPSDLVEEPVDGFVVDLVRDGRLIEIQTRGFASMKRKLRVLLDDHPVHVVHPVALERFIVRLDPATGEVLSRRRSPKRGTPVDVFAELVSFPDLVSHDGFSLEIILTREEEVRVHDPERGWRRRGWVVDERRLLEVVGTRVLASPDDLADLLPADLDEEFTTAELARVLGRPRRLAQQMAYCLRAAGALKMVGKTGNAIVYRRTAPAEPRPTPPPTTR